MSDKDRQAVRCVKLLELFHARGTLTTKDVMAKFGVDRQAARRDVLALIEAGIPIEQVGAGNAARNVLDETYQRSRFVFSVGGGVGTVVLRESMDDAIHSPKDIARITGAPPLAVIPYFELDEEVATRKRRRWYLVAAAVVALIAAIVLVHYHYRPLDVLYLQVIQQLGKAQPTQS